MRHLWILISVFIAIGISLLFRKACGKGEKTDNGFCFCYWRLSYRRKFIRTLWMLPVSIIVMCLFHITFKSYFLTCVTGVALGIVLIIQAVYNYRKWKETEKNK